MINPNNEKNRSNAKSNFDKIDKPSIDSVVKGRLAAAVQKAEQQLAVFMDQYKTIDLSSAIFSDNESIVSFTTNYNDLRFSCTQVGDYYEYSSIWQWSWLEGKDFDSKSKIMAVRNYGFSKKIERFTKSRWEATLEDAFQMAAVSMLILEGKVVFTMSEGAVIKYYVLLQEV